MNHPSSVVAKILSDWHSPVNWEVLRHMEQARELVRVDPDNLHNDLVETAKQFTPQLVSILTLMGLRTCKNIADGCAQQQEFMRYLALNYINLPYFVKPICSEEWESVLERINKTHPWFFFLIYTDPAL
jgi:hypothetical protein